MEFLIPRSAVPVKSSEASESALAGSGAFLERCHAHLVIDLSLFRVGQDTVRFIDLLELRLCLFVARICIRMILTCKAAECFLDVIIRGVSSDAKRGINRTVCAVGGPCTSYELVFMDPTEVGFCGKDSAALRMMKQAMQRPYYHISLTNDVIGLESAVALKNAYAMAVTLAVGLNIRWHGEDEPQHYNSQAGTFSQAVRETHALMQIQGGTFESECIGLGDLYVTIFSGRTRRCGVLMGKGLDYDQVTEALAGITLESLVITRVMGNAIRRKAELGMLDLKDFPLMMHIVDILDNGKADADLPWEAFTFEHLK